MQEHSRYLKYEINIGSIIPHSLCISHIADEHIQITDGDFLIFKVHLHLCFI